MFTAKSNLLTISTGTPIMTIAIIQYLPYHWIRKEIRRILKPEVILAISENFIYPEYPLKRTTRKYCRRGGFVLLNTSGGFFNYTMQFRRS